ncbi:MAG: LysM peptidoglycan-binding domain-containing protein [Bacteroidia bacterium]|nr:LysM peptidoglycan-binding domain-containing protein [Bacteroidia bacterium]MDW8348036.1 LysM peptidoglycan-binding domain-containing protein [Bacteroidia bacterium]
MRIIPSILTTFGIILHLFCQTTQQDTTKFNEALQYNHLDTTYTAEYTGIITKKYDFIEYGINFIQQPNHEAMKKFYDALSQSKYKKVTIVHIGDSHMQPDGYSYNLRNILQKEFGYAGRGMIFPYRAAGTHNSFTHYSEITGKWEGDFNGRRERKFDIGITGVTAHTSDPTASIKIGFRNEVSRADFDLVKLYYKRSPNTFNLKITTNDSASFILNCVADTVSNLPYISFRVPRGTKTLTLSMERVFRKLKDSTKIETSKFFELYGLSFELEKENGILYHAVGINGAPFEAILRQNLMEDQIKEMNPDLVIIDMGGNEYYGRGVHKESYTERLTKIVKNIHQWCPNASILLSSPHEFYYRRYYNKNWGKDARDVTKQVAFDNNCGFWDNYAISGGRYAVPKWQKEGLFGWDRIHLTPQGYGLRGALMAQGLLNSYQVYKKGEEYFYTIKDSLQKLIIEVENKKQVAPQETYYATNHININSGNQTTYIVQPGDVLGSIARKFGTTVFAIQSWNNLSGTLIHPGQKLIIYNSNTALNTDTKSITSYSDINTQNQRINGNIHPNTTINQDKTATVSMMPRGFPKTTTLTHTVTQGDNLWSIAKKYGTTIEKLCELNNITTKTILKIGMILQVR